jgi:hypothetical protein
MNRLEMALMHRLSRWMLVGGALAPVQLMGQYTPVVPGVTCDSTEASGRCAVWRITPAASRFYAAAFVGKRVRIRGAMIARCSDQTLYFSVDAARNLRREAGMRLFSQTPQILNALDSLAVVEVEGTVVGPYTDGIKKYAGALMDVVVIGRHRAIAPDSAAYPTIHPR